MQAVNRVKELEMKLGTRGIKILPTTHYCVNPKKTDRTPKSPQDANEIFHFNLNTAKNLLDRNAENVLWLHTFFLPHPQHWQRHESGCITDH